MLRMQGRVIKAECEIIEVPDTRGVLHTDRPQIEYIVKIKTGAGGTELCQINH